MSADPSAPVLRVIGADASSEEVAAIVGAVSAVLASGAAPATDTGEAPSAWITASRLRARGTGVRRGEWRRADRLGGRLPT